MNAASDFGFDVLLSWLNNGLLAWSWWQMLVFTLVVTHITIAAVTIYLHRCQAHRALELHPLASHFFRFWLWLTTGMVTKEWTAIHRKHHAKCETIDDPHSPQILGISTVLARGAELYKTESRNQETLDKFGHGTPDDWLERQVYSRFSWQGVALMLIIDVTLFGAIGLTIWAVQMLWIPITAAGVINGIGHFRGYRNFDCEDASTNIFPWGILIGGEELHNNHHTYATSAKLSNKWYEFDIGWLYIQMMSAVGLAKVKKISPKPVLSNLRPADHHTLEAIIANRHEIMARYSKTLSRFFSKEVQQMQVLASHLNDARTWLCKDEARMSEEEQAKLEELMGTDAQLRKMIEMRRDLQAIWGRSNATGEQLLAQLHTWCQRAEESGLSHLRDFSLRLRRYA